MFSYWILIVFICVIKLSVSCSIKPLISYSHPIPSGNSNNVHPWERTSYLESFLSENIKNLVISVGKQ